ncbi:hypothetical protein HDU67_000328 [Dinochytrium kinnereticum]|nr:hypothetical protein HDU67_000328 [Dinochytrium kinnereticum]
MSLQWSTIKLYANSSSPCSDSPAAQISRLYGPRCGATECFPYVSQPVSFQCSNALTFNQGDGQGGVGGFFDQIAATRRTPYFVYTSYADATCSLFAPNIQTASAREGTLSAIRADGTCITIPKGDQEASPPPPLPTTLSPNSTLARANAANAYYYRVTCPAPPGAAPDLSTSAPGLEDLGGVLTVLRCSDPTCDPAGCLPADQGGVATYALSPRRACLADAMLGTLERGFIVGECRVPGEGRDMVYPAPSGAGVAAATATATSSSASSSETSSAVVPTSAALGWRPSVMVVAGRARFDADAAVAEAFSLASTTTAFGGSATETRTVTAATTTTTSKRSGAIMVDAVGGMRVAVGVVAGVLMGALV